jgi:hypothetical protein
MNSATRATIYFCLSQDGDAIACFFERFGQRLFGSVEPFDFTTARRHRRIGRPRSVLLRHFFREDFSGKSDRVHQSDDRDHDLAYLAPEAARNTWYPYSVLVPVERNEQWLTSALQLVPSILENLSSSGIRAGTLGSWLTEVACDEVILRPTSHQGLPRGPPSVAKADLEGRLSCD